MTMDKMDKRSPRFEQAHQKWQIVDDLWGGTQGMRDAGERHIPRDVGERSQDRDGDARYMARLNRSTLTNFYKKTILKHSGKVFSQDIKVDYDRDDIKDWCDNIDLRNNNATQFAYNVLTDAYNKGVTYIITDHQVNPAAADGIKLNLAEERALGLRPYLTHIPASKMLDIRGDYVNGRYVPTLVRYVEEVLEYPADGFMPTVACQVKVLQVGSWSTFRQNQEKEWYLYEAGSTLLDFIPITAFMTNQTGFMIGEPPLEELAEKTVQYWRDSSDLANIMHVANCPILHYTGTNMDAQGQAVDIVIGPNSLVHSQNATNKLEWVEHNGNAIGKAMDNLKTQRDEMTLLGLEPLVTVAKTATEANLSAHDANSMLKAFALRLKDTLEQNIAWMLAYTGEYDAQTSSELGQLIISTNYGISGGDASEMADVIQMWKDKLISRKQALIEAQRRGIINPDLDADEILEEADAEAETVEETPVVEAPLVEEVLEAPIEGEPDPITDEEL